MEGYSEQGLFLGLNSRMSRMLTRAWILRLQYGPNRCVGEIDGEPAPEILAEGVRTGTMAMSQQLVCCRNPPDRIGTMTSDELLPLVYNELRRLASQKLTHEIPGQTLQATALVHEAYVRLVADKAELRWNSRGHFFAAAAEAMRRILVERARHRETAKAGGGRLRLTLDEAIAASEGQPDVDLIALDEFIDELAGHEPQAAELVKLRFFAGFGHLEAAEALGIERRAADRLWLLARSWLFRRLSET